MIPDDTNVLISHGPPFAILDRADDGWNCGCEELLRRIESLQHLKLVVFGHIHTAWGMTYRNGVTFVNASICDDNNKIKNEPIVFEA
jgi:Icc-related predicted phosphoesterase